MKHAPILAEGVLEKTATMFSIRPETQEKIDEWKKFEAELFSRVHLDGETKDLPQLGPFIYKNETSATYTGQYKDGKRHGRGLQVWEDGSVYDGYWKADEIHGKGMMFHSGGRYKGDLVEGQSHGRGVEEVFNEEPNLANVYEGRFRRGVKDGYGVTVYGNGDVYDGYYADGERRGKGKFTCHDGDISYGEWRGDYPHGRCVSIMTRYMMIQIGERRCEEWHGYGEVYTIDGWKRGVFIDGGHHTIM